MLINLGRLLMLCVWGFLLSNLFHPFPKPLKYFIDVALFFMVVMRPAAGAAEIHPAEGSADQLLARSQDLYLWRVRAVGLAEETAAHQEKVTATA